MNRSILFCIAVFNTFGFAKAQNLAPTFYEDVAPIIIKHCVECHRAGEVAPFPLVTYRDVAAKGKLIKYAVEDRIMPPWIADASYRHFENERIMTLLEIQTIQRWVIQGKKAGDKTNMPKIPKYAPNSMINRKPDLVLTMDKSFFIEGNNKETFAIIKFPIDIQEEKNVMAIEFMPDNRKLVHHVNMNVYPIDISLNIYAGASSISNQEFTEYDVFKRMNLIPQTGEMPRSIFYSGWVPGMSPQVFSGNIGFKLPKHGVILANTLHYDASPVDEFDNSKIHVYFSNEPVTRVVRLINMGSGAPGSPPVVPTLKLEPGEIKTFTIDAPIPADVSLLYVAAHMHYIGKSYLAYATTPDGRRIPLLKIKEWDFNWQEFYKLNPIIHLPAGTVLHVEATFDNTANNPNNPYSPPQTIISTGNMQSKQEMLNLIMLVLSYQPGDENLILD